jgi:formate dehydrogenase beta subunit
MAPTSPARRHRGFVKGRQAETRAVEDIAKLLDSQNSSPLRPDMLIENLHAIQDRFGHISEHHLAALAQFMGLSQPEVFETLSFYAHFDFVRDGENAPPPITVRICRGFACEMEKSRDLVDALRKLEGDKVRIVSVPCIGACDHAPAAMVGQTPIFSARAPAIAKAIGEASAAPCTPKPSAAERQYLTFADCLNGGRDRESVIQEVEASGLLGLGGAGFPAGRKWRFFTDAPKPRTLVVNADEGEPGTFKDRYCLEQDPCRVLEGALIAAWAIEAEDIYVYLRDEYPQIRHVLAREIAHLETSGLAGDVKINLRRGAGSYVCGEETALLESLEGKRGLPRNRPPYPAQKGLFGRPTLIHNVETLFRLRDIIKDGANAFQKAGRPRFYSVSGRVNDPGVKEAPSGITLNHLIKDHCGGMAKGHTLKAYLPGGASGGILPASMGDIPLDFESLEEHGCFIGSAAIAVLSDHDDIGAIVANLLHFFADESCGQCTPCRIGTEKMQVLAENPNANANLIKELAETMADASICGLGQAAANPILSVLRFFSEETEQ